MAFFDLNFSTPLALPRDSDTSSCHRIPEVDPFPADHPIIPGPSNPALPSVTPTTHHDSEVIETLLRPPTVSQIPVPRPLSKTSIRCVDYFASIDSAPPNFSLNNPVKLLSSVPPFDWCDSFSLPFHLELERDPTKFSLLDASFSSLSDDDSIHSWLALKIKSNPIALLFSHRNRSPGILHNMILNPDSGTFANPNIEIWALVRCCFDSLPLLIDTSNLSRLFTSTSVANVPSVHQILDHCVIPIPGANPSITYSFHLDTTRFEEQLPSTADYSDPVSNTFDCCSFLLLPPRISGKILALLNPKGKTPSLRISSFSSLGTKTYRTASLYWWIDPSCSQQAKANGMPFDDPYFLPYQKTIRFLWVLLHNSDSIPPFIPSHPDDFF